MATKLERQKELVGYRTTHDTCGGCKHFSSEKELPAWMRSDNEKMVSQGRTPTYTIPSSCVEGKMKCTLHGFSVKKTAVCNNFEGK